MYLQTLTTTGFTASICKSQYKRNGMCSLNMLKNENKVVVLVCFFFAKIYGITNHFISFFSYHSSKEYRCDVRLFANGSKFSSFCLVFESRRNEILKIIVDKAKRVVWLASSDAFLILSSLVCRMDRGEKVSRLGMHRERFRTQCI